MLKVLVCGGRDYLNRKNVFKVLGEIHRKSLISVIIDGAATGADTLGFAWSQENNITPNRFPADWDANGRKAGFIRNTEMLLHGKPDFVVAFPGGDGTANMIEQATDWFVPVLNIQKDYTQ